MRFASSVIAPLGLVLVVACGSADAGPSTANDADGGAPDGAADGGIRGIDHPAPTCKAVRTHLRGVLEGIDVEAHLCDFRYALVNHSPWANWTTFGEGLMFLSGPEDIFKTTTRTVSASAGMLRMPGETKAGGRVYCGFDSGTYYEGRKDSPPDAELTLKVAGYAGTCGGKGDGTLELSMPPAGGSVAQIAIGGAPRTRAVTAVVGNDETFVFVLDDGIVDVRLESPLPEGASGESKIKGATVGLREGGSRLLLACGEIEGTIVRTHTDKGDEHQLKLARIPSWIDCAVTTPAAGEMTLTHDPLP